MTNLPKCRSKSVVLSDEQPECCVCLLPTTSCTPCSHWLCMDCWGLLPNLLCPLCRRELPNSAGALPARLAAGDSLRHAVALVRAVGHTSNATGATRRFTSIADIVRASAALQLDALPNRIANRIMTVVQREVNGQTTNGLNGFLDAAELLASVNKSDRQVDTAVVAASTVLSLAVALRLSSMQLPELVAFAPRIVDLLEKSLLVPTKVLPAVCVVVRRVTNQTPDRENPTWQDVKNLINNLMTLRAHDIFLPFIEAVASCVARHLCDMVRRAGVEQMPSALQCAVALVELWPTAAREVTAGLRSWVPMRLHQLATRWAHGLTTEFTLTTPVTLLGTPPTPPSSPLPSAPPSWYANVKWWLDMLRASLSCGLLDYTRTQDICDILAPGLAREGVRTEATNTWSADRRQLVVARQLASELFHNPREIAYMPSDRLILFGCPENRPFTTTSQSFSATISTPPFVGRTSLVRSASATGARTNNRIAQLSPHNVGRVSPLSPTTNRRGALVRRRESSALP